PALRTAPAACCGLELALLDLGSRRAGVALARWLSSAASDSVRCSALLAGDAVDAPGFDSVKIKVGAASLERDIRRVRDVRQAARPGVRIRLDANGAWAPQQAAVALRALAPFEPELCEQPIPPGSPGAWRELRAIGVPL